MLFLEIKYAFANRGCEAILKIILECKGVTGTGAVPWIFLS